MLLYWFKGYTNSFIILTTYTAHRLACLLILLPLIIIPSMVNCATFYVDANEGKDNNDGHNLNNPWQTIAKVNGSTFKPGDFILFKRGCTWREQLNIPNSGAEGNPITFGAYGDGDKPAITGANMIPSDSWSLYSGKIYVANVGNITPPTQLYVDGIYYDIAHYPKEGYLMATANSTETTSIIDSNLALPASLIVGATIQVRAVPWWISTLSATAYDPASHKITLNGPVYDAAPIPMRTGYGYYLQNMLWMLTSPKGWYYDQAAGKLYLWTVNGDSPSGHTVEVSNRPNGISVKSRHFVTLQDLAISKANGDNIYALDANSLLLNNLDVFGGYQGIRFDWHTINSTIQKCSIRDALSNGIMVAWDISNISILNNTVKNAGNVGASPGTTRAGIVAGGSEINIATNTVIDSGYNGIFFVGDKISVESNVVDGSCLRLDDCGGIYTGGSQAGTTSKIIKGNTVINMVGNFSGTPNTMTQTRGIYLDEGTYNTLVDNNTIINADYGIHIHFGHDNFVKGNSFLGARRNSLWIQEDKGTPGCTHDNVITGNTFETISTGAAARFESTIEVTTDDFGRYDYNRYCHPNSNYVITNQNKNYTLSEWQQASGQDRNSTDIKSSCASQKPQAPKDLRTRGQ